MKKGRSVETVSGCVLGRVLFAAWIVVVSGVDARGQGQFPDVPKGHPAYQAVLELRHKAILIGYPNGTFNGVVPKGVLKPKPVYDLSTPQSAWKSLLRAMADADEEGIKGILAGDYDDSETTVFIRFTHLSDNISVRKREYRERAARWSTQDFHLFGISANGMEADAAMPDFNLAGDSNYLHQNGKVWIVMADCLYSAARLEGGTADGCASNQTRPRSQSFRKVISATSK